MDKRIIKGCVERMSGTQMRYPFVRWGERGVETLRRHNAATIVRTPRQTETNIFFPAEDVYMICQDVVVSQTL